MIGSFNFFAPFTRKSVANHNFNSNRSQFLKVSKQEKQLLSTSQLQENFNHVPTNQLFKQQERYIP
jgi:hypothetical protein